MTPPLPCLDICMVLIFLSRVLYWILQPSFLQNLYVFDEWPHFCFYSGGNLFIMILKIFRKFESRKVKLLICMVLTFLSLGVLYDPFHFRMAGSCLYCCEFISKFESHMVKLSSNWYLEIIKFPSQNAREYRKIY